LVPSPGRFALYVQRVSHEIKPAREREAASSLIGVLRDRAPRAALAIAAGQAAWPAVDWARGKLRERRTYTVKISGADDVYDDVHEWVLGLLPPHDRRALIAHSSYREARALASPDSPRQPVPVLRLRYDGSRVQAIRVRGHRVEVAVYDGGAEAENRDGGSWKPPEIMFTCTSAEGREAVLAEITGALARSRAGKRTPQFWMLGNWGGWDRFDDLPARPLDSVILADGQLERITGDIARFLASEADHVRRGLPWHRGYLFAGPPGTGKTSAARALASHFGMDTWYLPLSDVKRDGELLRLAGRVTPGSMLLLEDVDVFHAATSRDDDSEVTLSGLLNALDGIATPHGLVTVMTTNAPEALDPAVIRPGRVDLTETFGLADAGQAARLVSHYYGVPLDAADASGTAEVAPAEVIEACKRHDYPLDALASLGARGMLARGAA
jgi:hypothetical protein